MVWRRFSWRNDDNLAYVYRIVNKHMWHAYCWGYRNKTMIYELSISRRIRWYIILIDLGLPSPSNGQIKTSIFSYVACIILRNNIFKFRLSQYTCFCEPSWVFTEMVTCSTYWTLIILTKCKDNCTPDPLHTISGLLHNTAKFFC